MNDQELLEKAAKAAGLTIAYWAQDNYPVVRDGASTVGWNPLIFDSDALRLAVKVLNWPFGGRAFNDAVTVMYAVGKLPKDPYEATRRAIVRAAAQVGNQS